MPEPADDATDALMAMLKRRGFLQPAYEIYGGVAGFYDYGPLGQGLKRNFEALWRQHYVVQEGFGEISTPTVAPEAVFRASGHVDQFDDVLIECEACRAGARADHLLADEYARLTRETEEAIAAHVDDGDLDDEQAATLLQARDLVLEQLETHRATVEHEADEATIRQLMAVPDKGEKALSKVEETFGPYRVEMEACRFIVHDTGAEDAVVAAGEVLCLSCGEALGGNARVGPFNLMFATRIGPGSGEQGYIRPETAQGMFVTFDWLYRFNREQMPFGAVQIGRAYRNEISPRQGLIRLREFWQAEAEVFVAPGDKRHAAFGDVAGQRVTLVPDGQEPLEMTLGDAVEKGVIANETVAYFVAKTQQILVEAGLDEEKVRFRQHESDEMAHYAADCWDAEFLSSRYGWVECVGIADRGCYDLESHSEHSDKELTAFRRYEEPVEEQVARIEPNMAKLGPLFKGQAGQVAQALSALDPDGVSAGEPLELELNGETVEVPAEGYDLVETVERKTGERFLPHVIEPSYGIDRILYAVLEHNYEPKTSSDDWDVLHLPAHMAPVQVGVLPLVSKEGLPEQGQGILRELRQAGLVATYDEGGSIGRRYARLDEGGTPYAITVDHETLQGEGVTIRDRDTQEQVRVALDDLVATIQALVEGRQTFDALA